MTTQTHPRTDDDTYTPAVRLGQGDYVYEWPPRPTAQSATIDLDERPGISDGTWNQTWNPGMSLRDWRVACGAPNLPSSGDEELWVHIRESADSLHDAIRRYDELMLRRDIRYADAMLAELNKAAPEGNTTDG